MEKSGKTQALEREAQLAQALRANLRRRKASDQKPPPETPADDPPTGRLPSDPASG